ncbi:MAG: tetratricopeptide repeat protein [Candidatus Palauibacterales bacterium]|nr:tetratricopeptide repeat protein [Candidatus Palauibacterales bacterium]MDP2531078.1 tetratricopeptide repeat protein [Candidatus Palauibacterales bacterium]MDP2582742.1 tetratricopeptide repeat protein [Candidatus Palauibacterales bacterium]
MNSSSSFLEELKRRHVVRVALAYGAAAWLVLQMAGLVLPALGSPLWVFRVLLGVVALLFPIALVLAWAFEVTPEGVRRTEPADSPIARPIAQGRRVGGTLNTLTIAVLAGAVAVLAWRQFGPSRATSGRGTSAASDRSIAVLPFVNASDDSTNQYFSDGLSEDLIIALSQLPGLRVIGRESSFQFRGKDLDSKMIGQKLGVTHLLEGSVSREDDEVRIRAELVDAADGSMLWSVRYDRPYRKLFALQDDLTKAVATALEARLLGPGRPGAPAQSDRPPGGSVPAYNVFLEGNFYFRRFTEPDLRTAIDYYRQAIRLDAQYAAAYAALSHAWTDVGRGSPAGPERRQAYDSARAAADAALSLDPDLADGHLSRGILLQSQLDWRDSEAEYRRALELAPSSGPAQRYLASALATLGQLDEAVRLFRQALQADPLDAFAYSDLAWDLAGLGRYEEGAAAARRVIALQPTSPGRHAALAWNEVLRGDTAAALRAALAEPSPGARRAALALAYTALGDRARADPALDTLVSIDGNVNAFGIAEIYALRREPDPAFAWLDRAWRQHDPGISGFLADPFLLRYRDDPRYAAFCRKAGLPPPGEAGAGAGMKARSAA